MYSGVHISVTLIMRGTYHMIPYGPTGRVDLELRGLCFLSHANAESKVEDTSAANLLALGLGFRVEGFCLPSYDNYAAEDMSYFIIFGVIVLNTIAALFRMAVRFRIQVLWGCGLVVPESLPATGTSGKIITPLLSPPHGHVSAPVSRL